jgi:hypothetical protein
MFLLAIRDSRAPRASWFNRHPQICLTPGHPESTHCQTRPRDPHAIHVYPAPHRRKTPHSPSRHVSTHSHTSLPDMSPSVDTRTRPIGDSHQRRQTLSPVTQDLVSTPDALCYKMVPCLIPLDRDTERCPRTRVFAIITRRSAHCSLLRTHKPGSQLLPCSARALMPLRPVPQPMVRLLPFKELPSFPKSTYP